MELSYQIEQMIDFTALDLTAITINTAIYAISINSNIKHQIHMIDSCDKYIAKIVDIRTHPTLQTFRFDLSFDLIDFDLNNICYKIQKGIKFVILIE